MENKITMSVNNNSQKNVDEATKPVDDLFTALQCQINLKLLSNIAGRGITYKDVINNLITRIATHIVVSPETKHLYKPGYYDIDLNAEVVDTINSDNGSIMLIMKGNPFIKVSDGQSPSRFSIYVPEDAYYGPEDD